MFTQNEIDAMTSQAQYILEYRWLTEERELAQAVLALAAEVTRLLSLRCEQPGIVSGSGPVSRTMITFGGLIICDR